MLRGMAHLIVVEDDDRIAVPLVRTLEREGHTVERFDQGLPALRRVLAAGVDLLLLDLGLPDVDGLEVCRGVRDGGFVGGIIVLTARDDELDRVVGLDSGADDYIAKPFALAELLARTRALLRRSAPVPAADQPRATPVPSAHPVDPAHPARPDAHAPALRVERGARRVWVGTQELSLTPKEFDLIALLESEQGQVLTRERLISDVWDENWYGSTKTLDTTLGRLRQKLADAGAAVEVVTVRGVGFRLEGIAGHA